ncbi:MAG: hypothetical protein WCO00_14425 [Rhodospirillaceae bacterium]
MVPWFDLTIWSEWASVVGLAISLIGLGLSIWVLRRTGTIERAVRKAEAEMRRPKRIEDIESVCGTIHTLIQDSSSNPLVVSGMLGTVNALVQKLSESESDNENALRCLENIRSTCSEHEQGSERNMLRNLYQHLNKLKVYLSDRCLRPETLRRTI